MKAALWTWVAVMAATGLPAIAGGYTAIGACFLGSAAVAGYCARIW